MQRLKPIAPIENTIWMRMFFCFAILMLITQMSQTQERRQKAPNLVLEEYHPKSMMVAEYHVPPKSKFPSIDVHNHLGKSGVRVLDPAADDQGDGRGGSRPGGQPGWRVGRRLKATIAKFEKAYPGRFLTYARVDWSRIDEPDFGRKAAGSWKPM